jgi:ABC-2 type transport system ATP-binding protein
MDEATRCDRIALIQQGRILGVDTPAAITAAFDRPLIAVTPANRYAALRTLRDYPHVHSVFPFGETLHFTDRRGEPADVIVREVKAFLASHGEPAADVRLTPPTIEDVFMARMGAAA